MTVQFANAFNAHKFAKKYLYVGCCANALTSPFHTVTFHTNLYQVELDTQMSVPEVEGLLNDAKIKFKWVSQF